MNETTISPPSKLSQTIPERLYSKEVLGPTGDWRVKIRAERSSFNDREKGIFLEEFAKHNRIHDAAAKAGVTVGIVKYARAADIDFKAAYEEAEHAYKSRLIGHHQELIFEGTEKISYGRNGEMISKEKIYPIRLIELELKKHDEGYREKREVDMNMKVSGGVLVAPAEMKSIDDWESRFNNATVVEAIVEETEPTVVEETPNEG